MIHIRKLGTGTEFLCNDYIKGEDKRLFSCKSLTKSKSDYDVAFCWIKSGMVAGCHGD